MRRRACGAMTPALGSGPIGAHKVGCNVQTKVQSGGKTGGRRC